MSKNERVCFCFNVTSDDIKKSIEEGVDSIHEVRRNTKAGMGCSRCLGIVERVTYNLLKENNK